MPESQQSRPAHVPAGYSPPAERPSFVSGAEGISALGLLSIVIRWRRLIGGLAVLGGALGAVAGLTKTREYASSATFVPHTPEGVSSGLAAAVGQLGIRLPAAGGTWGPPMYMEVLRSRAVLEPIVLDTIPVLERGGERVAVLDLLEIREPSEALRLDAGVRALDALVSASEVRGLAAVRVEVSTPWPSVSHALAVRLLERVQAFNVQTRKSQATAERQFVEEQSREAEVALRQSEDRLRTFLERNRVLGSPELMMAQDRLRREVTLRQELYTSLMQAREEARIKEVRDTPVITLLEEPRLPVVGEPRGTVQKGIIGGLTGAILGLLLALIAHQLRRARQAAAPEATEVFQLIDEAKPKFLRRWGG